MIKKGFYTVLLYKGKEERHLDKENNLKQVTDLLYRSSPAIRQVMSSVFSDNTGNGSTSTLQIMLLSVLDEQDEISMGDLATQLALSKSNATMHVDKLVDRGLVERYNSTEDRRVILVRITEKGHDFLNRCKKGTAEELRLKVSILKANEMADLTDAMNVISKILSKK